MLDNLQKISKAIENNTSVIAVVASLSSCSTCNEWIPNILLPICKKNNVEVYKVNLDEELVILPPAYTPTTYFYVSGHRDPMIISGPEFEENIAQRLKVCFNELETVTQGE
jgi:outer membrane protein assembly factor BamE (lipoprotein component of BamABCDE complex)